MGLTVAVTKQGLLEGVDMGGYALFRGVPYAEPPAGELRFHSPVPVKPWEGVRKAQVFPPVAWQARPAEGSFYEREFYRDDWDKLNLSEDCLYLNIWTPAKSTKERLPVLFWIHGGAFCQGYGHEIEFDGEAYCKKGIILVTVNYRLGVLGFLAHPWLGEQKSGNYGIQDQICALDWIYHNIRAFGGDTENITVAGQSAGAFSVQALITSPLSKGSISKAIMQSGGGYNETLNRFVPLKESWKEGEAFVEACGIKTVKELMSVDAQLLLKAARSFHFSVPVDGYILKDNCLSLIQKGDYPDIPCLLGSTKNDIRVTPEMVQKKLRGDLWTANINFAGNMLLSHNSPVYLYYFSRELPGDNAGAFHSGELWYMFGTLKRCWRQFTKEDYRISENMIDYWSNFIRYGEPGSVEERSWEPYTNENPFILEIC